MPLFVHVLRILMLFLNIYDSYKTLRRPPPSSRNEGRPSQRALVQRKRDMKGCLAVWIVWVCLITYEGYVEALVSLFVPFYDEIKSLGLLFLIMTRARGAEPIYLYFIRPLVKPYSPTIDLVLDLARMFGDILFVALSIPTEFVHTWYRKIVPLSDNNLETQTENTPVTTTLPTRPVASRSNRVENGKHDQKPVCLPKTMSSNGRPSSHSDRQPSRPRTRVDQVGHRVQAAYPKAHQIWYPPPSSYSDEEDGREASTSQPSSSNGEKGVLSNEAIHEQKALEEWRQYPAFPSAYPPTPMVVSSAALPSTSLAATRVQPIVSSLMLTEILEDLPQQDFSMSLLPPRKPLNPGFVEDLSDEIQTPGVQSDILETMYIDSDSEDEDVFNTTLQTPVPPLRASRSGVIPTLPIDREFSVASSAATGSTALTTNTRNSLQTQSSSESLSSGDISMSDLSSSVLGKKRPLPLDVLDVNTASEMASGKSRTRGALGPNAGSRRLPSSGTSRTQIVIVDETVSTSDSVDDRKSKHPKRRKVGQTPKRSTLVTRPIRPTTRIARIAAAPTKVTISKPLKVPSSRDAPAPSTRSTLHRSDSSVASDTSRTKSSSSINEVAKQTIRPNAKNMKGKSQQVASRPPSRTT